MILKKCILMTAIVAVGLFAVSACGDDDEVTPSLEVGETVTDFVKVKQYEDSKTFQSDLDALVTCALDLNSFRLCWLLMVSNGFEDNKLFCATAKELDEDEYGYGEISWDILAHIVENSETYKEAIERLETSGILSKANETRGISDMFDFFRGAQKSLTMGRKSVVAIINKAGWGSDAAMMEELYKALPSNTRRGYSTATEFWKAYSNGDIDNRSNVVFTTLYATHPDFRDKAMELGVTPSRNLGIVGAQLINSGLSLVIDATPGSLGGFASGFGYGKDIYGSIEAGYELAKNRDWKSVKNYVQNGINGAATYLPYLINLRNGNGWTGLDLFDDFDKTIAQGAIINITSNYEDYLKEIFGKEEGIITNPVTAKDKNGNPINLTIIQDQKTGQTVIGLPTDNHGMIVCNPKTVGMKAITVVNKNTGKRKTKIVSIGDDPEVVTFDLEHDERELEENPKNGILKLERNPLPDDGYGGNYKVMIETNYLYYTCKPDSTDKWISASVGKDINYLYVQLTKNDTGKERTGHVTVAATDSKGKVLKSTVLTVKQTPPPVYKEWVDASPSSLEFDAQGGKKEVVITHSNALSYTLCSADKSLDGWCDLDWKETETGWNIVVEAQPNDTGKERSGFFTVYATNSEENRQRANKEGVFDKNLVKAVTVQVKQTADMQNGTSVTPQLLEVPSVGGALSVKLTFGNYSNCNYVLSDKASQWIKAGWNIDYLTPKRHGNQYYVIVAPNDTKKARTDTLKIYFANSPNAPEKDRYYMPVVVKQQAGTYNLQDLSKLFVGKWWNPNEGPDNLGGYMYYRFSFNSNGSYTLETQYSKTKGGDSSKWAIAQSGTYSVTSYSLYNTCIRVNLKLTYKNSNGETKTDIDFAEVYPHFMRMTGSYMEKQE